MNFSISPEKIVDLLLNRRRVKEEKIGDFLESIAKEARLLADIWQEVWKQVTEKAIKIKIWKSSHLLYELHPDKVKLLPLSDKIYLLHAYYFGWAYNIKPFHRLEAFYLELSNVLGGKVDSEFHNQFHYHLSSLLMKRKLTKKAFEQILVFINECVFLNEENSKVKFEDVTKMIEALHKEASALEVLAKRYRASV